MNFKPITRVDFIVIHCAATPEGRDLDIKDIDRMHRERGFRKVGYHYVIKLDGTVQTGRAENEPGSHAVNFNGRSIGVCYIGGVDRQMKPKDTRTPEQLASMERLIRQLRAKYPNAKILGHRDLPRVAKDCPSFSVAEWLKAVGIPNP